MFQTTFIERGFGLCFVGTGIVTAGEMHKAKLELWACEDTLRRVTFALVDFQAATEMALESADIHRIVEIDMRLAAMRPNLVVAIIAPKDHIFGLARMWETLAESTGWKTGVFRSSGEACKWVTQHSTVQ